MPTDYDEPRSKTVELALLKFPARKPAAKIGTLFINPGGPGGSATLTANIADFFLQDDVLDHFDVVGIDPRGVGASANITCFKSHRDETMALTGMQVPFPHGTREEKAFVKSAKALGRACSTTGKVGASSASTAEVARDMELIRRAVGDTKLTFLGWSYGTAIGQYYANMFPDRVRAIVLDGVVDAVDWAGTPATQNTILDDRLQSADGADRALREMLHRCDAAGQTRCAFASGDPIHNFEALLRHLKARPITIDEGELKGLTYTYADFISEVLENLYSPAGSNSIADLAAALWKAMGQSATATDTTLTTRVARARTGHDFPQDLSLTAYSSVVCTDALHPSNAERWPPLVTRSEARAPYFGRTWAWSTVQCARNSWTARDEDAYRGPFTKRTSAPLLVVGSYWDPATNYRQAVSTAKRQPSSRLLSSNNWGHTAYGTSDCATNAIDRYLLHGTLPAANTVCTGDIQPFTQSMSPTRAGLEVTGARRAEINTHGLSITRPPARGEHKLLPPVARRTPLTA